MIKEADVLEHNDFPSWIKRNTQEILNLSGFKELD